MRKRLYRVPAILLFAVATSAVLMATPANDVGSKSGLPRFDAAVAAQPAVAPMPKEKADAETLFIDGPGGKPVRVVDPSQLQFKSVKKRFSVPANTTPLKDVVPPPATFDWSKGGTISFPMLGNDRKGDCFLVAPLHQIQAWTGMNGITTTFDTNAVITRYTKLSRGDNGLSDEDVIPEWKAGMLGPNGPHKVLDVALVDPADWQSVKTACYYLGGVITTHSLRTTWMTGIKPGMIWDATGSINPKAGHAVQESGIATVNGKEMLQVNTWGIQVYMTKEGLANSGAEVLAAVSVEWFNSKGFSPTGTHYNEVAKYWELCTGHKLPAGLFPDPVGPTPTPPVPIPPAPGPSSGNVVIDPVAKTVSLPAGWSVAGGSVAPVAGATNPIHEIIRSRAAHKLARQDGAGLVVSKSELAAARAKIDAAVDDATLDALAKEKGVKVAGPLTDFIDWLTSHQAEIESLIAIILKLVSLFSHADVMPNEFTFPTPERSLAA